MENNGCRRWQVASRLDVVDEIVQVLPQAKLIRRVEMTKQVLIFLVLPANNPGES